MFSFFICNVWVWLWGLWVQVGVGSVVGMGEYVSVGGYGVYECGVCGWVGGMWHVWVGCVVGMGNVGIGGCGVGGCGWM